MKTLARQRRSGNVLVLTMLLMTSLMAMLAFAVDIGYLNVVKTQLQRSADAAALAATWRLVDENAPTAAVSPAVLITRAEANAGAYAGLNNSMTIAPELAAEDVAIGYLATPESELDTNIVTGANAVRVRVRRDAEQNGAVPLFFARVLGFNVHSCRAEATAMVLKSIRGFNAPESGENLDLLPFALDEDTWDDMLAGGGTDNWRWNNSTKTVTAGSDGIREVNLFPQSTGAPGNRGTVDIGGSNNSTADIARQILEGVNSADLAHHGGKLEFDDNGELELNGDTGISAGVKDELNSIKGQPRVIPVFRSVSGPGNNAQYVIVKFVGIRICEVQLTGKMSNKRLIIQPANVWIRGGIPGPPQATTSQYVYSPVWLVR